MVEEPAYYPEIGTELENVFQGMRNGNDVVIRIEDTHKHESDLLQQFISDDTRKKFNRHKPDLAGVIHHRHENSATHSLIAEVKNRDLRLDDIYQMLKYADLFQTSYSFLITTETIPDELVDFFEHRIAPIESDLSFKRSRGIVFLEYSPETQRFERYVTPKESGALHVTQVLKRTFGNP